MKLTDSFQFKAIKGFKFGSSPLGKPNMWVHLFFIDGLLIDTGHSNMSKEVLATVQNLHVEQIYLTHHHEDHSGNVDLLSNHFNSPVYAPKKCVEIIPNPPDISLVQKLIWGKAKPFFTAIAKDDFIETPNYRFEIIAVPGHSIDMVCLLEKKQGWLFSADLWVANKIKFFMRPESMAQQIASIKKILQYDFEVLLCSHNPQLKNGKTCLEQKLVFLEEFYGKVAELYHKGYTAKVIFKKLDLKENKRIKFLSGGALSSFNRVLSVVRDEDEKRG